MLPCHDSHHGLAVLSAMGLQAWFPPWPCQGFCYGLPWFLLRPFHGTYYGAMVSAMSLPWFVYASIIVAYWLTSAWRSVVQPLPWEHGVQTNVTLTLHSRGSTHTLPICHVLYTLPGRGRLARLLRIRILAMELCVKKQQLCEYGCKCWITFISIFNSYDAI